MMPVDPDTVSAVQIVTRSASGPVVSGATVKLFNRDAQGDDDGFADIWDDAGDPIDQSTDPVESDTDGVARFLAAGGLYNLEVETTAGTSRWEAYQVGLASARDVGTEDDQLPASGQILDLLFGDLEGEAGRVPVVADNEEGFDLVESGALPVQVKTETANYTLVAGDAGAYIRMDVAGANTLTVPEEASVNFPVGTVVQVAQVGAGETTIVAGGASTINTPETLVLRKQWAMASLIKVGADEWDIIGDLELAE
jgi:hypothetical protein